VYDCRKRREATIYMYEFVDSTTFCRKIIVHTCILWIPWKFKIMKPHGIARKTRTNILNVLADIQRASVAFKRIVVGSVKPAGILTRPFNLKTAIGSRKSAQPLVNM
jgi:hypothetical protein